MTYVDASGRRRTQRNVYIPWSLTVTPISQSDVGSVQASSLFLVSRLNCSDHDQRRDRLVIESEQRRADELLMMRELARTGAGCPFPETVDRLLVGVCRGDLAGAAGPSESLAIVVLIDLGRSGTPLGGDGNRTRRGCSTASSWCPVW